MGRDTDGRPPKPVGQLELYRYKMDALVKASSTSSHPSFSVSLLVFLFPRYISHQYCVGRTSMGSRSHRYLEDGGDC